MTYTYYVGAFRSATLELRHLQRQLTSCAVFTQTFLSAPINDEESSFPLAFRCVSVKLALLKCCDCCALLWAKRELNSYLSLLSVCMGVERHTRDDAVLVVMFIVLFSTKTWTRWCVYCGQSTDPRITTVFTWTRKHLWSCMTPSEAWRGALITCKLKGATNTVWSHPCDVLQSTVNLLACFDKIT